MGILSSFQNIFKIQELKSRVLFTLALLAVYRVGAHIPTPGINGEALSRFLTEKGGALMGFFDMFSGGALSRVTIFALGIMPYISASIILQLLTVVIPAIGKLAKEGEAGRKKIVRYTRYGTVVIAAIQSFGIAAGLEGMAGGTFVQNPGWSFRILTMITLTSGTAFIMWLGEQITERGIGNGISLIIFAGIVARFPNAVISTVQTGPGRSTLHIFCHISLLVMMIAVIGCNHIYGKRAEKDTCSVCKESSRTKGLWRTGHASASEDKYLRSYTADICILHSHFPGHGCGFYRDTVGTVDGQTALSRYDTVYIAVRRNDIFLCLFLYCDNFQSC